MHSLRQLLGSKAPEVYAVAPGDSVIDAIRLMAQKGIGAVLVMDGAHLAGIVSERDYAR
jgi:CBS domain-containing protein